MDLSVIILNWNTKVETRACLESILDQEHRYAVQIIVADNASSDGSQAMLAAEFPQIRVVQHSENLGFCAGNNQAIPSTTGRYVLFLNSDTVVTTGAFDAMVEFADSQPNLGILGPKLLNQDGSLQFSCRQFPNLGAGIFRNTPFGRLFPNNKYTSKYLMSEWDHATVRDVDWVSGAALMIRRDMLDATGGFDEEYYMFCEDVDICYRVLAMGRRVVYFPDSIIYHIIGRSTNQVPTRMTYIFHRSQYRFYTKHYRQKTSRFVRPFILPFIILRASGLIMRYRLRYWQNKLRGRRKL